MFIVFINSFSLGSPIDALKTLEELPEEEASVGPATAPATAPEKDQSSPTSPTLKSGLEEDSEDWLDWNTEKRGSGVV